MIKNDILHIINNSTKRSISIDLSHGSVFVNDMAYDIENPHFKIEINKLNFHLHAQECNDCKSLIDSLGTNSLNWSLFYHDKEYIIDFRKSGNFPNANKITRESRQFFNGTKFRFNILLEGTKTLTQELQVAELNEDFEECAILRDLIKDLE